MRAALAAALTAVTAVTAVSAVSAAAEPPAAPPPAVQPPAAPAHIQAPADLVLLHGRFTPRMPAAASSQAIAVRGNTIIAVGTDQAVAALIGPQTRTVDLHGRVVLPGIIDAHTHPADGCAGSGQVQSGR